MSNDDLTPPHWGADAIPAVTPVVKVNPLVWEFHPVNPQTGFLPYDIAPGIGGSYLIEHCRGNGGEFDMWLPNQVNGTRFDTREAAKAAAQTDYEARILAAIEPDPDLARLRAENAQLVAANQALVADATRMRTALDNLNPDGGVGFSESYEEGYRAAIEDTIAALQGGAA